LPTACVTCAGALAESAWGVEKASQRRKRLGTPQNPQRQVHALLGGFVQDVPIENQNHRDKTDQIIARTLLFSKNQKVVTFQNACRKKTLPNKPER